MKILIALLLMSFVAYTSNMKIDSLSRVLERTTERKKPKILNQIAEEYNKISYSSSIEYSKKAIELQKRLRISKELAQSYINLGISYGMMHKYDDAEMNIKYSLDLAVKSQNKRIQSSCYNALGNLAKARGELSDALDYYDKSLEIREQTNDKEGISATYNNIGLIYFSKGILDKALEYFYLSKDIAEQVGHKPLIASSLINLANLHNQMNKNDKALEFLTIAVKLRDEIGDTIGVIATYANFGNIYLARNDFDSALMYYKKSLAHSESIQDIMGISTAHNNIGLVYFNMLKFDEAKFHLYKSLELSQEMGNKYSIVTVLNNIADLYVKMGAYNRAMDYVKQSVDIATELDYKIILKENYGLLSKIYENNGGLDKALEYYKLYSLTNDSLYNQEILKKTAELEFRLDLDRKDKENELLKKENEVQNLFLYLLIVILIFAAATIVTIYLRFLYKKKVNNLLKDKNYELELANQSKERFLSIIRNELSKASDYVLSLIPQEINDKQIETEWIFVPSAELGGDSFGYHSIDDKHFAFYLFDVSDHGIGAALHSVAILNTIKFETLPNTDFKEPDQVLSALNNVFQMKEHENFYFTIWYGVYNYDNKELKYASAGHPPALLFDKNGRNDKLYTNNLFIGGVRNFPYKMGTCVTDSDVTIYIFSDGVYEILLSDGRYWELDEFNDLLIDYHNNKYPLTEVLLNARKLHGKEQLEDDFSILKIVIKNS